MRKNVPDRIGSYRFGSWPKILSPNLDHFYFMRILESIKPPIGGRFESNSERIKPYGGSLQTDLRVFAPINSRVIAVRSRWKLLFAFLLLFSHSRPISGIMSIFWYIGRYYSIGRYRPPKNNFWNPYHHFGYPLYRPSPKPATQNRPSGIA